MHPTHWLISTQVAATPRRVQEQNDDDQRLRAVPREQPVRRAHDWHFHRAFHKQREAAERRGAAEAPDDEDEEEGHDEAEACV